MASHEIQDSQITASSELNSIHGATHARINLTTIPQVRVAAWIARPSDASPWLQVDFMENTTVIEIGTQGRDNSPQWVKTYAVRYSLDGTDFKRYENNGQLKVKTR